jgi:hypothetical protein
MRHEVKLAVPANDLAKVRAALALLPTSPRPLFADRVVQSVYLDTFGGAAVRDNLAGVSRREKLRLRWYGASAGGVLAQLECKRRSNAVGDKLTFDLPRPVDVDGVPRWRLLRELERMASPEFRERLCGTEITQWIRYRRSYLGSLDGVVRVTIDREIVAFDQRHRGTLSCRYATPLPALVIVELKAPLAARDVLEQWLQRLPWRPGRCSKYLLATSRTAGPLLPSGDD